MAQIVVTRKKTAALWASQNPILERANRGVETDTLKEKVGDGETAWNDLDYVTDAAETLTGKSIDLGDNAVTMTAAQLDAAISDDNVVYEGSSDTISGDKVFTGGVTVKDANFVVIDDSDASKQAKFQLAGVTAGNIRTMTVPDASGTLVLAAATQTLTGKSIDATQLTGTLQAAQEPAHTGDVTNSAGSLALTIAARAVTFAKAQAIATARFLGRVTAGSGDIEELTAAQMLAALGLGVPAFGILTADHALANGTSLQKLFNWSTNGALTLATGVYVFDATLLITSMDSTSGNMLFDILGAGSATLARGMMHTVGVDNNNPANGLAQSGSIRAATVTGSSMLLATVGTALGASVWGSFDVTGSGTIIPSGQLANAAPAVVNANSFFRCLRIGPTGGNLAGSWS